MTFDEAVSSGHHDASLHVGGHGEPYDFKVIVVTREGITRVCARIDGDETVTEVGSVREGLELFGDALRTAIKALPVN